MMRKTRSELVRPSRLAELCDIVGDRHVIAATMGPHLEPIILSLGQTPD